MNSFLDRLLPARLRRKKELTADERAKLFAQVADTNPCLLAVIDLMEDQLEGNFIVATNPENPPEKRIQAINRMGIAYDNLQKIEQEREMSREIERREAEARR